MARGKLISIEGLDGAGKTTLTGDLRAELRRRGVQAQLLREPGGVQAAEEIRALVKDPSARISARAEALLYAAARAQLVEEALEPLLKSGAWVLLDRFVDSSLAYQGAGRRLGLEAIRTINAFATAGLTPDRTLLLRINPATARARSHGRGALDRLELEPGDFFTRIAEAYDELSRAEPDRIRVIDAEQPPTVVLSAALNELADLV
jgi:dTMP kinase